MTVLNRLGAFVATASSAALPAEERAILRRHFIDAMVAAAAGARTSEAAELAPLFGDDLPDRIALLAATIRLTEIDDIHLSSCTTPSSAIAPAVALLAAAEPPAEPDRLADALWVGIELLARLGVAIGGPRVLYRGVWPTYFAAPVGVAAAAARLYALDAAQAANALSIALTFTSGGTGRFAAGKTPRWLLHAQAVRSGLVAARAAREGYAGDTDLLDRPWLKDTHGLEAEPEALTAGLGEASVYADLSLKPWCSAKQAIGAVAALRALLDEGLRPEAVRAIRVRVPPAYARMIDAPADPARRSSTFASVRYQLALAAFAPASLFDVERADLPWDERITAFMAKIAVAPDEGLQAHYPRRWPAALDVETDIGPLAAEVVEAPGDPAPERRLDDAALAEKAHRILDPELGAARADALIGAARAALDEPAAAARLVTLLAPGQR